MICNMICIYVIYYFQFIIDGGALPYVHPMVLCFSMVQDFDSLHPDDQDQLQSILDKDAATRWSTSLPVVPLTSLYQCTDNGPKYVLKLYLFWCY